jgi:outer membrane protein W
MKKIILISLVLLLFHSFAFSQDFAVDKGSILFAGMASFSTSGGDLYENADGDRAMNITLEPSVNYFVIQNVGVGLKAQYSRDSQGDYTSSTLGIGPNLAYFLGDAESNMFPYLGAGFHYITNSVDDYTISGTDIAIIAGVLAPVKKNLGIMINASYHMMSLKHEDWDEAESGNIIMVGIGIAGMLY